MLRFRKTSPFSYRLSWKGREFAYFLKQRPGKDHGESAGIFINNIWYRVEYDRDGDLCFTYAPIDGNKQIHCLVVYLSKIYLRDVSISQENEKRWFSYV